MTAKVSGKGTRFYCHRFFQDQAGEMLAKSGYIAGCPVLDLKGIHPFFIIVKLEWFQVGLYAGLVFHGIPPL